MSLPLSRSASFALDRELIVRWLRATAIIALPALVSMASALQSGTPVSTTVVLGTLLASLVDFVRRYVSDYSVTDDA